MKDAVLYICKKLIGQRLVYSVKHKPRFSFEREAWIDISGTPGDEGIEETEKNAMTRLMLFCESKPIYNEGNADQQLPFKMIFSQDLRLNRIVSSELQTGDKRVHRHESLEVELPTTEADAMLFYRVLQRIYNLQETR